MAAIGGDIIEVKYNHPTIGSGVLFPKAGEDSEFDPGGFRNDDSEDGIDGSGGAIYKKNRKRWKCTVTLGWDNNIRQELEKLFNIAQSSVEATWTISHVSGAVYKGLGQVVGDIKGNGNAATIPLNLAGSGLLTKII